VSVTADQIQAFAPEFAATPDAQIDLYLALAADFVDVSAFGATAATALTLWVCHALTVTTGGEAGAAGSAQASRKVGDVSVTYASGQSQATGTPAWLQGSSYGRMYLQLARRFVGTFRAVG